MKKIFSVLLIVGLLYNFSISQTVINQDITENTTWTAAGSPYLLIAEYLIVQEGVTLTIEPGVVVKFNDWRFEFWINGTLIADGESGNNIPSLDPKSIIFTSFKDDAHGGDSNNNGDADTPAPGDWKSIVINETGSALFKKCLFLYGGDNFARPMLDVRTEIDTIWNCKFTDSYSHAIKSIAASLAVEFSYIETANGISVSGGDLYLYHNYFNVVNTPIEAGWGDSSIIRLVDNSIEHSNTTGNHANGCRIFGNYYGDSRFEGQAEIPFFGEFQIEEGASLTLKEGTIMKFHDWWSSITIKGSLYALGTEIKPIFFTSITDDSVGGDTNGDGNATIDEPKFWGGLIFSGVNSSRLEHVIMKYAGGDGGNLGAIVIDDTKVEFEKCVFSDNDKTVIRFNNTNSEITNCTFSNNFSALSIDNKSLPVIQSNDFMLNVEAGAAVIVDNFQNPNIADLTNNYWASSLGPSVSNGPTTPGDRIVGPADFAPFETEMVNDFLIPKPVLNISQNGNQITCSQASSSDYENVIWDFGDGQTSNNAIAYHTYDMIGVYDVCYIATAEYDVKIKECQLIDLSTGVHYVDPAVLKLKVYPNPVVDELYFEFDLPEKGNGEIYLLNTVGEKLDQIYKGSFQSGQNTMRHQLINVEQGFYFIEIRVDKLISTVKVIVM